MRITSPQYGPIDLKPVNADNISGYILPDSKISRCETEFGAITIQQVNADHFSLRYSVYSLIKKVVLMIQEEAAVLRSQFVLKGRIRIQGKQESDTYLRDGQFMFFNTDAQGLKAFIEAGTEHRLFDATYSYEFLRPLLQVFPSLENYIRNQPQPDYPASLNQPVPCSAEMTKSVFDLFRCPYDEHLRKLYFENKTNEFLMEALAKTFNRKPSKSKFSETERDAIFVARDLILADITRHIPIKEISKRINLNEFKLKAGFKEIFGIGPFEMLLQARMEKARELLLETNKPMKEIAVLTGFEFLANFIAAFRKYYGYTPGELRRK